MPLFVIKWSSSCLFTLDTFQLRITFALTAGFLTIVPDLWLLNLRSNIRIFQNKKSIDIIKKVLKDAGINPTQYKVQTTKAYEPREYCVQYRETDYNFICRLMEEEGIYFYFEHSENNHLIIFTDSKSSHKAIKGDSNINFITRGSLTNKQTEYVTSIKKSCKIQTGKVSIKDYNFQKPSYKLSAENTGDKFTNHEKYDYPGYFYNDSVGKIKSTANIENQNAYSNNFNGTSLVPRFIPGSTFSVINHESDDFNIKHLLLSTSHNGSQPQVLESISGNQGTSYGCSFQSIPAQVQYRPDKLHQKPSVEGVQTAMVTGPAGEEIYTDEYGRIKVQFHWDREGKKDEKTSCWMRVSQKWAGPGWGSVFIPRIGQEVIVDFIDGDPDRPIVTGAIYNGDNKPPYPLPDEKTKSTIRTESSPGGEGYNEIRFEDKKGEEELYIQAEKDRTELIKNNSTTTVKNDSFLTVEKNRTTIIKGEKESLSIENGTREISVKGIETHTNAADLKHDIAGNYTLNIGGNMDIIVTGIVTIKGQTINLNP
ncbi:MAG: type VI secretion system tip protein VgrG [Desulfobacteraceae bacterium]|nr:type VI secretion system tip protein VgrG [Desulfobacteraceae bacterium]